MLHHRGNKIEVFDPIRSLIHESIFRGFHGSYFSANPRISPPRNRGNRAACPILNILKQRPALKPLVLLVSLDILIS